MLNLILIYINEYEINVRMYGAGAGETRVPGFSVFTTRNLLTYTPSHVPLPSISGS